MKQKNDFLDSAKKEFFELLCDDCMVGEPVSFFEKKCKESFRNGVEVGMKRKKERKAE